MDGSAGAGVAVVRDTEGKKKRRKGEPDQPCVAGHLEMWPYNMGRAAGEDRGMCWLGDLAPDQEHC